MPFGFLLLSGVAKAALGHAGKAAATKAAGKVAANAAGGALKHAAGKGAAGRGSLHLPQGTTTVAKQLVKRGARAWLRGDGSDQSDDPKDAKRRAE
jgi:hypothetical protein